MKVICEWRHCTIFGFWSCGDALRRSLALNCDRLKLITVGVFSVRYASLSAILQFFLTHHLKRWVTGVRDVIGDLLNGQVAN